MVVSSSMTSLNAVPLAGVPSVIPRWRKFTVTYSDLATAGLTNNVVVFSLLANEVIHTCLLKHSVAFSGGLISAYTISVGITGTATKYLTAANVFAAVADTTLTAVDVTATQPESFSSATSIKAFATAIGANLSAATAGSADIWVLTSTLA